MLKISFANAELPTQHALIVTVAEKHKLGEHGAKLDSKLDGVLKRAMVGSSFTGAKGDTLTVMAPGKSKLTRIVLAGIGEPEKADAGVMESVGGAAVAALGNNDSQAVFLVDGFDGIDVGIAAAHAALGARLRTYRFEKYLTKQKPEQKAQLKSLIFASDEQGKARKDFAELDKIADGVFLTRDLVSEPPNVLNPKTLAEICMELKGLDIKVEVLDEKKMKQLGMGSLLGVAQGSVIPARLVAMEWHGNPGAKNKSPVLFVGKGVTFDSGGLSLKPPAGMEQMKYDMAGAGAVIGAMKVLAGRKAKANVVGIVGLVENMPSGNAQRPGDVVTSMSGQTIEVLNTDAEGRLVLADVLWYGQEEYKPHCIVDLATLTGAIRIALGSEYAGLFCNDDRLSDQLVSAGKAVAEPLWRLPLGDAYDKLLESPIADMKNIGSGGGAGSITAAQFLQRFIQKGTPWAHLDIAAMAWLDVDKKICPKGASAYGVRLLDQFVRETVEGK
jgi:leucyl aminopeptidase